VAAIFSFRPTVVPRSFFNPSSVTAKSWSPFGLLLPFARVRVVSLSRSVFSHPLTFGAGLSDPVLSIYFAPYPPSFGRFSRPHLNCSYMPELPPFTPFVFSVPSPFLNRFPISSFKLPEVFAFFQDVTF